MKLIRTVLLIAFPFYFISCGTQKPLPNYLETIKDTSDNKEVVIPELRIQKNDNLFIQVYSSAIDPKADEVYNLRSAGSSSSPGQASVSGFLVDIKGNIEYPRIGLLHVEGLTKLELEDLIKRKINETKELSNPVVIVRFLNFKVAVLGEVKSPGVLTIPGERVTILEAIGLAGDINEYGLKDQVKVVREIEGKRQIGMVDLSSDSLFLSPYYNLLQNDVVLVQATKRRAKKAEQDLVFQRIGFALSLLTAITLIYTIFR